MVRHKRKLNIYITKIRKLLRLERITKYPKKRRQRLRIRAWRLNYGGRRYRVVKEWDAWQHFLEKHFSNPHTTQKDRNKILGRYGLKGH